MNWFLVSAIAQGTLCIYFTVVHWVPLFPWNNLTVHLFPQEKRVNLVWTIIIALSTFVYLSKIHWVKIVTLVFWNIWMAGHVLAWWIPYIKGASQKDMEDYQKVFGKTFKFLPPIKNHPVPDACHTILGILSLIVFVSSWMAILRLN